MVDEICGDPARSDGRLQPGGLLVEVDGRSLVGLTYAEGFKILKGTPKMATFRVKKMREEAGGVPSRKGVEPDMRGAVSTDVKAKVNTASSYQSVVHSKTETGAPLLSLSEVLTMHQPEVDLVQETASSTDLGMIDIDLQEPSDQDMPLGSDLFRSSRTNHAPELDHAYKLDHAHQLDRPLGRSGHMFAGGVTTTSHEGALPGGDGDGDLTDVTDTEIESDDEISAPPPPLPTSPIPHDTPTHTLVVEDS